MIDELRDLFAIKIEIVAERGLRRIALKRDRLGRCVLRESRHLDFGWKSRVQFFRLILLRCICRLSRRCLLNLKRLCCGAAAPASAGLNSRLRRCSLLRLLRS